MRLLFVGVVVLWTGMLIFSFLITWRQSVNCLKSLALTEARSDCNSDLASHVWAALQGGVYVALTEKTPPNPYLSGLPDRDVTTTSGLRLTLVNPESLVRQVHELVRERCGVQGHIASLDPIRPQNAADAWEHRALCVLESGSEEVSSLEMMDGKPFLRMMRPLTIQTSCLKCHAAQGYKKGDIGGGISISIPFAPYLAVAAKQRMISARAHLLIGLFGLSGLLLGIKTYNRYLHDLRANEEKYRRLFEDDLTGNFLATPDGAVIDCNLAFVRMLGYGNKSSVQKSKISVLYSGLSEWGIIVDALGANGKLKNLEAVLKCKDGREINVIENLVAVFDEAGEISGIKGYIFDITERKQYEQALRESEERLEFALKKVHTGGWYFDLVNHTVFHTLEHDRIFGYESRLPVWTYEMFLDHIIPKDRDELDRRFREAVESCGDLEYECRFRRRDGEVRWLWLTGEYLHYDTAGIKRMAGIVQDITERKQAEAEREKLQAKLNQAQKMESVGRLAGGVAHDFNNMIGVILGHTELALEQMDAANPILFNLLEIQEAAQRSADLNRQLLAYARKQVIAPRVLDLNQTVEGVLKMLKRLIGEDIELVWRPGEGLWPVKIDPSQIDQILANLCVNARDAITDVGKVTIETANRVFDAEYCSRHTGFEPGQYVMLVVSDNGSGIEKDILSKIFDPFFTTKEMGKGTGLGLSMVYGAVKQNRGFINVYSETGYGTTFKIYLPRHDGLSVQILIEETALLSLRGQETILLVEDHPGLLRMINEMLERQGYTVLVAGTPGEALRLASEHAGKIHLVMTDVIMPEMNGRELARKLLLLHPDTKCLFASGYTADVITSKGVLDEGVKFIQKPFSLIDLATKVREALDND
ncbi:PAS domain S-box protein [bacterium]|nr:PAS domain S-box protein [bacterium]